MLRPFPHFLDFFSSFNVFSLLRLCWFLFSFPKFYDGDNHFLVIVTLEQFDNCRKNKTKKESLLPIWDLEAPRCLVRRVFSWPRFLLLPLRCVVKSRDPRGISLSSYKCPELTLVVSLAPAGARTKWNSFVPLLLFLRECPITRRSGRILMMMILQRRYPVPLAQNGMAAA